MCVLLVGLEIHESVEKFSVAEEGTMKAISEGAKNISH